MIKNMNKKAFMKTVEVVIVIVLTAVYMLTILPQNADISASPNIDYLSKLQTNNDFRKLATQKQGCFDATDTDTNNIIGKYIPPDFEYKICFDATFSALPDKEVSAESIFFAGNETDINYKVVRLYAWAR